MRPEICINSNLNPFTKFTNSSRSTVLSSQGASWHGICLFIACQQRVIKTFTGPGYFCSEDGVVWLWHDMVNLHIYSSPFYLATAQSQYPLLIRRDGGLSTLCLSYWFACQQRVLKTFLGPGYLCYQDGGVVWPWHFLVYIKDTKYIQNLRSSLSINLKKSVKFYRQLAERKIMLIEV